ncbi:MAG: sugar phosphate isomerase/epimerase [Actinobacteria bacterium]|nr:sugar phosphate isomerase/epimerase [Actinomycetota bacterium]
MATIWNISGFGDEIADEAVTQLAVLQRLGVQALEPRRIRLPGGTLKNIVDLSDDDLRALDELLQDHGMRCSQIGSPVGKAPLDADFDDQLRQLDGAIRAARALGTRYVRVFSFLPPGEAAMPAARTTALARFQGLAEHAARKEPAVVLTLENEHDLFGARPSECLAFLQVAEADNVAMCFDPGNFVRAGVRPFDEAWPILGPATQMLHIKDYRASDGAWVPAGEGQGQLHEILQAADPARVTFLSIEPHLATSAWGAGRPRDALWREAHAALRALLDPV